MSDPIIRNESLNQPADARVYHTGAIAKWTCWILGVAFILIGLMGFFAEDEYLMNMFMVNTFHNIVHLVSGSVLLAVGFLHEAAARVTLWVFAALYGLVAILGFMGVEPMIDLMHLNLADNWLNVVITAIAVGGALASHAARRRGLDHVTVAPAAYHTPPPPPQL